MIESVKLKDKAQVKYINDISEEIIEPLMMGLARDKPESYSKVNFIRKSTFATLLKIMKSISEKKRMRYKSNL